MNANHQKIRKAPRIIALGLIVPLIALACRVSIPEQASQSLNKDQVIFSTPVSPGDLPISSIVEDEQNLLIELYKHVNPAVVNITVFASQNNSTLPFGQGSGFVIDLNGNIVTNAHVIQSASQIEVSFSDGTIMPAELIGEDLNSDLAVVKVESLPSGVEPLLLGNMDDVQVGQTVLALGNPFGLDGTLTRGIVSAVGRTIPALTPFSIPRAIQTDAPINPGNSGGPLLNLEGEVIGVNAQIETDGENRANSGVGFAIPVSIIKKVVPELIANGKIDWAWLGVQGTSLTPTIAEAMNLDFSRGAYITGIADGGPAQKSGLIGADQVVNQNGREIPVGGDIITAINGQEVLSFDDLLIYIALEATPGQELTLTIVRDGKPQEVKLRLEPRPSTVRFDQQQEAP